MDLSNFLILDHDGNETEADGSGCHLAFSCPDCLHPVLASAMDGEAGFDEDSPSTCRGCGEKYFLDVRAHAEKLYISKMGYQAPD